MTLRKDDHSSVGSLAEFWTETDMRNSSWITLITKRNTSRVCLYHRIPHSSKCPITTLNKIHFLCCYYMCSHYLAMCKCFLTKWRGTGKALFLTLAGCFGFCYSLRVTLSALTLFGVNFTGWQVSPFFYFLFSVRNHWNLIICLSFSYNMFYYKCYTDLDSSQMARIHHTFLRVRDQIQFSELNAATMSQLMHGLTKIQWPCR